MRAKVEEYSKEFIQLCLEMQTLSLMLYLLHGLINLERTFVGIGARDCLHLGLGLVNPEVKSLPPESLCK